MAETAPARPPEQDGAAGSLTVAHRVVRKVVEQTARTVPGVTVRTGTLDSLRGLSSPHADVRMTGGSATVQLTVDALWPCDLTGVAARVRDTVLEQTPRLTGIDVHTVDVQIRAVTPGDDARGRKVQ